MGLGGIVLLFLGVFGFVGTGVFGLPPWFYVVDVYGDGWYGFTIVSWRGGVYVFDSWVIVYSGDDARWGPVAVFPRGLDSSSPLILDVNNELNVNRVVGRVRGTNIWVGVSWVAAYSRGSLAVFERDKNPYVIASGKPFVLAEPEYREPGVYHVVSGVVVAGYGDLWTMLDTLFRAETGFLGGTYPLPDAEIPFLDEKTRVLAKYIAGYLEEHMEWGMGCVWTRDGCDVHAAAVAGYALAKYAEAVGDEEILSIARRVLVSVAEHGVRGDGAPLYVYHPETNAWGTEYYANSVVNLTWTSTAGYLWLALEYCNDTLGELACSDALQRLATWAEEMMLPNGCWAQAYLWNNTPVEWDGARWMRLNPSKMDPIYCSVVAVPALHALLAETRGPGARSPVGNALLHPLPVAWSYSTGWDLQGLPPVIHGYLALYELTGDKRYLVEAETWWARTLALIELRSTPLMDGIHDSLGLLSSNNACHGCWAIGGGLPQLVASTPPSVPEWARSLAYNAFTKAVNEWGIYLPEIQCSPANPTRNEGVWFKNLPWVLLALLELGD